MKKDLEDVCNYMKALVIPEMPDGFKVADKFRHGLTDDEIRKGVDAFRAFLYALFEKLIAQKDVIDVKTRDNYNPYDRRDKANIRVCLPTIFDLAMILFTLGIRGNLEMAEKKLVVHAEDVLTAICEKTEKYISLIKMSDARKAEMFRILFDLGLRFNGAEFSKIEDFDVSHIDNDYFVVGLKLLAEATQNHKDYYYIMNVFMVLLQCDFYPLANAVPKKYTLHINEFSRPQPPEIREWVACVDDLLMKNGCAMVRSDGNFQYTKRGRSVTHGMVCIIRLDITGCFVIPGVNHLAQPNSILDMLPGDMVDVFTDGKQRMRFLPEQCRRRTGNMGFSRYTYALGGEEFEGCRHAGLRCQFSDDKCRFAGYRFDLADPNVREWAKKWIEMELAV